MLSFCSVFLVHSGGHNFYAGYVKKAVIQLCITLFSCFTGSFISWIWAIVEACMVNRDDDGLLSYNLIPTQPWSTHELFHHPRRPAIRSVYVADLQRYVASGESSLPTWRAARA